MGTQIIKLVVNVKKRGRRRGGRKTLDKMRHKRETIQGEGGAVEIGRIIGGGGGTER